MLEVQSKDLNHMSKFSQRQISGATKVRNLLKSLMLPSVKDLKKIIQFNLIKNNPCTLEDVRVAELIWGPEIEPHAVKGKGTRKKPIPQSQDIVSIPPEVKRDRSVLNVRMPVDGQTRAIDSHWRLQ